MVTAEVPTGPSGADGLVVRLRAAGCVFAEEEAALLLGAASGVELEALVRRREAGEPLELVLGGSDFAGVRVRLLAGVFVPRRRTEAVVDLAVAALPRGGLLVDLCCGSGAVGAAVAARRPDAEVHGAELDPDAVACARLNLDVVHEGDLYDALPTALRSRVDVLAVNAPYVPSGEVALMPREARDHEHRLALDGGADGLDLHRRVLAGAAAWLAPGGVVLLETSAHQADGTLAASTAAGLDSHVVTRPEQRATVLVARAAAPLWPTRSARGRIGR